MMVWRRHVNSDVDQRATAIDRTTGGDRLFGYLWARRFHILLTLILIYLLTAIGLLPGGSTHLHTNNT